MEHKDASIGSPPRFSEQPELADLLDVEKCGDRSLPTQDAAQVVEYLNSVRTSHIHVNLAF